MADPIKIVIDGSTQPSIVRINESDLPSIVKIDENENQPSRIEVTTDDTSLIRIESNEQVPSVIKMNVGERGAAGVDGVDGNADPSWDYYKDNWQVEPSLNVTTPLVGGSAYDYTNEGVTRYRYVPDPYDPLEDKFYETYVSGVFGSLIVSRGNLP